MTENKKHPILKPFSKVIRSTNDRNKCVHTTHALHISPRRERGNPGVEHVMVEASDSGFYIERRRIN